MNVFDDEGVDPATMQLAHTGDTDDLVYIEELLGRRPLIGMNRYGLDIILAADKRNETVLALLERGYADRMFVSADAVGDFDWFDLELVEQMEPNWKSTYVFEKIVSQLREGGMSDEQLETMMVDNPRRWLSGES